MTLSQKVRSAIFERDENKCNFCGSVTDLHIHHRDRDRKNNTDSNLVLVCRQCHVKIHFRGSVSQNHKKIKELRAEGYSIEEIGKILYFTKSQMEKLRRREANRRLIILPIDNYFARV